MSCFLCRHAHRNRLRVEYNLKFGRELWECYGKEPWRNPSTADTIRMLNQTERALMWKICGPAEANPTTTLPPRPAVWHGADHTSEEIAERVTAYLMSTPLRGAASELSCHACKGAA